MILPIDMLAENGGLLYNSEAVTQLQHSLQTAHYAVQGGANEPLILAALLHNISHLLAPASKIAIQRGQELPHETISAQFLSTFYGPPVVEPVLLHVLAKRYLARDPDYIRSLSPDSQRSLSRQGGPMHAAAANIFRAKPFANEALRLRRWNDLARDPDAIVPGLEAYLDIERRLRNATAVTPQTA